MENKNTGLPNVFGSPAILTEGCESLFGSPAIQPQRTRGFASPRYRGFALIEKDGPNIPVRSIPCPHYARLFGRLARGRKVRDLTRYIITFIKFFRGLRRVIDGERRVVEGLNKFF